MAEPAVAPALPDFTPVHLITGFLGAGKTTLLKRLLAQPALSDAAVLINEFGEVGLDHHLLERIDEQTVLLPSGCVCCTVRGELVDALLSLLSRRERGEVPPFRRVVIESTGLADPFPIVSTLHADPVLRHHVRFGVVVTLVDAVHGAGQLDAHEQSVRQAAMADRLVYSKTGLAGPQAAAALRARIAAINPLAPHWDAETDPIDADELLGGAAIDLSIRPGPAQAWYAQALAATRRLPVDIEDGAVRADGTDGTKATEATEATEATDGSDRSDGTEAMDRLERPEGLEGAVEADGMDGAEVIDGAEGSKGSKSSKGGGKGAAPALADGRYLGALRRATAGRHDADIRAFTITLDAPLDWTRFGIWLTMFVHRHGERMLRFKGLLNVQGSDTPVAVHGVQHLIHPPEHLSAWPGAERQSLLVFITMGIESAIVERSLRAFLGIPA